MAKSINAAQARRQAVPGCPLARNRADSGYEQRSRSSVHDIPEVPVSKRHQATSPSAPWTWSDFHVDVHHVHWRPTPREVPENCEWSQYSCGLVGNRTHKLEVNGSQMSTHCNDREVSTIYKVSILDDGSFDKQVEAGTVRRDDEDYLRAYWDRLQVPPPSNVRVQVLFVEGKQVPILQMLGTKYNIDPFFFSTSTNCIASRRQEIPNAFEDHITIILPFICTLKSQRPITRSEPLRPPVSPSATSQLRGIEHSVPYVGQKKTIDVQAPLFLPGNKILFPDLLSLYMVRSTMMSTIISYDPNLQSRGGSARHMQSLVQRTGEDFYWSRIFKRFKDPTLVLLGIFWYAVYAWDETLDVLFGHINTLEYGVLESNNIIATRELHELEMHILHYERLLRDFLRSVKFLKDTPNPAMRTSSISQVEREDSEKILRAEVDNLTSEIKRLTRRREMLSARLDNITRLTFMTINSEHSKARRRLAAVTAQELTTLKQRAYLSMIFIPAAFLANVFMVPLIVETLARYAVVAFGLTLFTLWIVIGFQKKSSLLH